MAETNLSPEERVVVQHFEEKHYRTSSRRFVVPLPKKNNIRPIGESRSQAVQRLLSLEWTLRARNQFDDFSEVMKEYLKLGHAEVVPRHEPSHVRDLLSANACCSQAIQHHY